MATPTSGADSWLTINGKPLKFQDNDENLHVHAVEKGKNLLRVTRTAPDSLEIYVDNEELETGVYGKWYWQPKQFAGLYELEVRAPGYMPQIAKVRVYPEKLTQVRYEIMLNDLSTIALDLLFRLNSPASEKAIVQERDQDTSPLRDYKQITLIMQELKNVMAQIRLSPHRVLHEHYERRLLHEVQQFSNEAIPVSGPTVTLPLTVATSCILHHLPETWMVQQHSLTYDIYENRLLKQFVQRQLISKLNMIKARAENEIKRREPVRAMKIRKGWQDDETAEIVKLDQAITECQRMVQRCIAWSSEPFLKSVKPSVLSNKATQVLLKNPFYSRFYSLYLSFQKELKISLNTEKYLTMLGLRKVCDLYEIWSVFQVTKIVLEQLITAEYDFLASNLFYEVEKDCFHFEVQKNISSIILIKDDVRVEIKYEPIYHSHLTADNVSTLVTSQYKDKYLTPDLAIEVYQQGQPPQVIIFDPKYSWYREADNSHSPNEDDINKMRTYRDLICYKAYNTDHSDYRLQNIVASAYILYPGDVLYREPENVVGALPLIPNMARPKREEVEMEIKNILRLAHLL